METSIKIENQTLDEKLSEAFGIFRIYSKEDTEQLFGIDPTTEILESLKSGYIF